VTGGIDLDADALRLLATNALAAAYELDAV
jgi:hypothetical protein